MPKKHMIDAENELWNKVLKYKIDYKKKNLNETVIELIKKGLKLIR